MHGAPHLQPMNRIVVREPVNQPLKGMGLLERMLQTRDEPAAVFFLCSHGYASFALSVHGPGARGAPLLEVLQDAQITSAGIKP